MTYIIAELGQNHNGCMATARKLIDSAKYARVNAVKFTLRDLDYEMTQEMWDKPYTSCNSYGETYGEHRKALELEPYQVAELTTYAANSGLDVVYTFCSHTLFDNKTVRTYLIPKARYIKVASRDITNTLLLSKIATYTDKEVIVSSGMSDFNELSSALQILHKNRCSVMHCVSKYPTRDCDANLVRINMLNTLFKGRYEIGYSDHTIGNDAIKAAVAMGCKIIEKHITLDPLSKGSDHICSSDPGALKQLVADIASVETLLGSDVHVVLSEVDAETKASRDKLMRSVALKRDYKRGEIIKSEDICLLSPGSGIPGTRTDYVINKSCNRDIPAKSLIGWEDVK